MRVAYIHTAPQPKQVSKKEKFMQEVNDMIEEQRAIDRMQAIKFFNKLRNEKPKSRSTTDSRTPLLEKAHRN